MKLISMAALAVAALSAQTSQTIPFRAVLLPNNEVPAVSIEARGASTVWLHVVRDAGGQVTSASVDFNTSYQFPGEVNITGMHIHKGRAGENGPITIDSGISAAGPVADTTGKGVLNRQGQVAPDSTAGLDTVNGMLSDPSGFYVNVHTTVNPSGVIRGQLQRAEMTVLMGLMSPANEVPPITDSNGSGMASVIALRTLGANGTPTSGQVIFDTNYTGFSEGTTFTGFHIHQGPAGVNGPVTINTGIGGGDASVPANAAGGNLHYEVEVPVATAASAVTLNSLFDNSGATYINLHTTVYPGGVIRAQLRRTDRMTFPVIMSPANEVPPITGLSATAPANVVIYTLRNSSGMVTAGTAVFDVNFRFPGEISFTGLHIHDGKAGANGPVTIDTGTSARAPVTSATGQGNIYRVVNVSTTAGLATLNSLVANPENHYVNLHTPANPGGAVRSQLAAANTAMPSVTAVISAVSDPGLRTVARGGLMTIFGANFAKTMADIGSSFDGTTVPSAFNGTSVTIGGKQAALVTVMPTYIVSQVPIDAAIGPQPVEVTTANGKSSFANVAVAETAPALFFDTEGAIATNLSYQLLRPDFPAKAGDIVWIYATGLGLATSASGSSGNLTTGQIPPVAGPLYNVAAPIRVTVGGRDANVVASVASPGFAGLYQVAFTIPEGAGTGNVPVVVMAGSAASNSAMLPLR